VFSGIIDATGTIADVRQVPGGCVLVVRAAGGYWRDVSAGASVAIDGVCLTATGIDGGDARFDVVAETLRRSTLGDLGRGDTVNLQKSLAAGDRIDGHFVQGHIDAIGVVARADQTPAESKWWIRVDEAVRPYIVPKGSVAVDGISLTIADVEGELFSVALIPTTLDRTTIGRKRAGARVNIETDVIARTVVHCLRGVMPARD
jgi:riboflavin synthase alpha subunit